METLLESTSMRASVCSDIELKVADTRCERQAAFELVYNAYCRNGLCANGTNGMRFTPYQLLPTTDIFIAKLRGEVVSTLSLVRDGELGLPMEEVFASEVAERRAAGMRLAEVSCLADRRQNSERFFGLFCDLSRLMAQLAAKLGVNELVVTVHPRHAPLYRRYMAFLPVGDRREYPAVCNNPAVALSLNFERALIETPKKWNEFFGSPLPDSVLRSCPISAADRAFFLSLQSENDFAEYEVLACA
jgi:N-acyl amino acid synthase FeeM